MESNENSKKKISADIMTQLLSKCALCKRVLQKKVAAGSGNSHCVNLRKNMGSLLFKCNLNLERKTPSLAALLSDGGMFNCVVFYSI